MRYCCSDILSSEWHRNSFSIPFFAGSWSRISHWHLGHGSGVQVCSSALQTDERKRKRSGWWRSDSLHNGWLARRTGQRKWTNHGATTRKGNNFSCAESNANELEQKIFLISIWTNPKLGWYFTPKKNLIFRYQPELWMQFRTSWALYQGVRFPLVRNHATNSKNALSAATPSN